MTLRTAAKTAPKPGRTEWGIVAFLASCAAHGAVAGAVTTLQAAPSSLPRLEDLSVEVLEPELPEVTAPPGEPPEPRAPAEPEEPPSVPPPAAPPEVAETPAVPADPAPTEAADPEPPSPEPSAAEPTAAEEAPSATTGGEPLVTSPGATDGGPAPGSPGRGGPAQGDGGRGRPGPAGAARGPRAVAPSGPAAPLAPIPLADLSERPRPPALDGLLERNYPAGARLQGRAGSARVALFIGPTGQVTSVRLVAASDPEFGEACRKTLAGSRWTAPRDPAGRPAATIVPYECRFRVTP
jgi:TonB family protein